MPTREDVRIDILEENVRMNSDPSGKTYFLFMAIDKYDSEIGILNNAVSDAKKVLNSLFDNYNFDNSNQPDFLIDEQVTKNSIEKTFKKYERILTDQDSLIFFFSGHGSYDRKTKEGFWLTFESKSNQIDSFLANSKVLEYLRKLKARHVLGIVDACFSGAIFNDYKLANIGSKNFSLPSRWILTAGRLEPVLDGSLGSCSPFAKSLLAQLNHYNGTHFWVGELSENVLKGVTYNTEKQIPRGEPLFGIGHHGGEYRIVSKNALRPRGVISISNFKKKLMEELEDNRWEGVFTQLKSVLSARDLNITLTQIIGQYKDLQKEKLRNVSKRAKVKLALNQLRIDLLNFIDELQSKDFKK